LSHLTGRNLEAVMHSWWNWTCTLYWGFFIDGD